MKLDLPIIIREDFDELVFQTMDDVVRHVRRKLDIVRMSDSQQRQARVSLGHSLQMLREQVEHGEVLGLYERIGLNKRTAQACMQLNREIGDGIGGIDRAKLATWKQAKAEAKAQASPAGGAQAARVHDHDDSRAEPCAFDEPASAANGDEPNADRANEAVETSAEGRAESRPSTGPQGPVVIGPQLTLDWSSTVDRHHGLIDRIEDLRLGGELDADRSRTAAQIIAECDARLDELLNADPSENTAKLTTRSGSPSQTGGSDCNPFPLGRAGGFSDDDDARDESVQPSISLSSVPPGAHQRSAGF